MAAKHCKNADTVVMDVAIAYTFRSVCNVSVTDVVLLQDVIRVHTGRESRVVLRRVSTGDSDAMRTTLSELRQQHISKVFVHLSFSDSALFLKAVIYVNFIGSACPLPRKHY